MAKGTIWIRKRLTVSTYRAVTNGFFLVPAQFTNRTTCREWLEDQSKCEGPVHSATEHLPNLLKEFFHSGRYHLYELRGVVAFPLARWQKLANLAARIQYCVH
jgi:hypothetical protein